MTKRFFLKTTAALAFAATLGSAQAQNTPIKFQLDWRFEGPAALFLTPVAKGYFKDAKLDVVVDAGATWTHLGLTDTHQIGRVTGTRV